MGDAFMAGLGVGVFKDYSDISKWVTMKHIIEPQKENKAVYDQNYEIYLDLYTATQPLMHRLSDLKR